MSGEPQPGGPDRLDRAVQQLKVVWFALVSGSIVITAMAVAVVSSNDAPVADLGDFAYLFLLAVPASLFGAFVVAPVTGPKDPGQVVRAGNGPKATFEGWDSARPDDPFYWYPAYLPGFFLRAGMLEGAAILCAVGFLASSNWVLLGGAVFMIAVLATQVPTRAKVEAFADAARARAASAG